MMRYEPKRNIRSMRFSDRMIEIIEAQAGDNFTQKFESLVTRCVWELPEAERRLDELHKEYDARRQELAKLAGHCSDMKIHLSAIEKQIYELMGTYVWRHL